MEKDVVFELEVNSVRAFIADEYFTSFELHDVRKLEANMMSCTVHPPLTGKQVSTTCLPRFLLSISPVDFQVFAVHFYHPEPAVELVGQLCMRSRTNTALYYSTSSYVNLKRGSVKGKEKRCPASLTHTNPNGCEPTLLSLDMGINPLAPSKLHPSLHDDRKDNLHRSSRDPRSGPRDIRIPDGRTKGR